MYTQKMPNFMCTKITSSLRKQPHYQMNQMMNQNHCFL